MKLLTDQVLIKAYIDKYKLNYLFEPHLIKYCRLHTFEKGEFICEPEQEMIYFYFFVSGKAKVYNTFENGKKIQLRFYEPLQVIGDIEIASDINYQVTVEAQSQCTCIGIPKHEAKLEYVNNVVFSNYIGYNLACKLDNLSHFSSRNLLYPLKDRLMDYLVKNCKKDSNTLVLKNSYGDIADLLGTSYRHLNRTFNELISEEVIKKDGYTITFIDKT